MVNDYTNEDLFAKWEEFFATTPYRLAVIEASALYPDVRSVYVRYADLDQYDPDMAIMLLAEPDRMTRIAEGAMKKIAPPSQGDAEIHMRMRELPRDSRVDIRELRSKHLGRLISVEGLVRKATEVRPKLTKAMFKCARCGAEILEPQEGMSFKEPMECYKGQGGCEKTASATKFILVPERSSYVDTQKVEVQESPEGLRGGAQPERLNGFLEDDIAGKISPGDRIVLNGILRSVQKGNKEKSTLFDINLDVMSAEYQQHEYEEIVITEEDEERIIREAASPNIMKRIIASISPTIYGLDMEKEAIALQLFGGVQKSLDDGTNIRGDIHILMVGDPGVAKCVSGDSMVTLADGSERRIDAIVDEAVRENMNIDVDDGVYAPISLDVLTLDGDRFREGKAVRAWRREPPRSMVRLTTSKGKELTVTPTHPLLSPRGWKETKEVAVGEEIAILEEGGMGYDFVLTKEPLPPPERVYDLEVEGAHNYVANGIVSHNSQLLRYMSMLAPRGIYASGKSSSAAGLCVHPDTMIFSNGETLSIGDFVEERMDSPEEHRPGIWRQEIDSDMVLALSSSAVRSRPVQAIWRIDTPSFLLEIEAGERTIVLTPETRLLARRGSIIDWFMAKDLEVGDVMAICEPGGGRMFCPMRWEDLTAVRRLDEDLPEDVYDLTVYASHSFIGNGFIVHNTAAAVKDDFGDGRWTLEAGALVLADKGLACIDELDKMTDQDRSSMHEAMESQKISVAKAGITATLQCRCSILGAANPKYGRFEEHQYIADQINLPPALMSRFDMIFAMTDKPDQTRDRNITEHILSAHRRGQVLRYENPEEDLDREMVGDIMRKTEVMQPVFDIDFLRKYVAYSKKVVPVLTPEAVKLIEETYLKIRKQGEGEGSSVPITARQLEAFVRLSEASARARLSREVTIDDAQRAVRIVEYYLRKIAGESGGLDIDIMMTGTSHSQREQITILKSLISEMAEDKFGVPLEDLIQSAGSEGIKEDRTRTLLKRLVTSGEVYQARPGYYKMAM